MGQIEDQHNEKNPFTGPCRPVRPGHRIVNANTLVERFTTDPSLSGWQVTVTRICFQWDSTNQVLDVTWDSTQTNSYFYHPLGLTLTTNDSFCVQFDLRLSDATASNYGNQLAIGLLHYSDATSPDFNRANSSTPNLFEFDYFPAFDFNGDSFSASINATLKDSQPGYAGFYVVYDNVTLDSGVTYRIVLIHRAGEETITGGVYTNGVLISTLPLGYGSGPVGDFQLDTLSVNCFADDGYGDSVLAHGTVDNLACASPLPLTRSAPSPPEKFNSSATPTGSTRWSKPPISKRGRPPRPPLLATDEPRVKAANPPAGNIFYHVRADLP